ncbi:MULTISPECIES: sensor histidine kinase KdpD [unclassified Lentimicrobium]|uniref:sensor histidine kinase n=1 Tax=unclassified Lentimicrobium TaxID=2677434 RepID=UPI0015547435|nr:MULTISPECIES: HAMP domain-containing sensor histidine kinase [unclassified Lentimicrobium]NPD44431.1 HAMP domain-containing histidine kinase [Lentimicrobium sp. S6]NPD84303.1 HAMP domain-containing histidine kinase [Lentimicrobium sp. L6]
MKKSTGILIIILSGLSIFGVVITQFIWIDNAINLKKEQFVDQVQVTLKTVVNNLYTIQNTYENVNMFNPSCNHILDDAKHHVEYPVLDSILAAELASIRIKKNYYYAVYREEQNHRSLSGGHIGDYGDELLSSSYCVSLSCLYNHRETYYLSIYFPNQGHIIFEQMITGILISAIFVLIIGFSFIYIIYVSFRQKRISLIKNDFVNNMTHEFKTPIATVSLTSEMLLRDEILSDLPKARRYAKVIYDENQRLKHQVEQVLQIAVIDKGELKIRKKDVDTHKVLNDLINKMEISVSSKGGVIKTYFAANYPKIWADKMHFVNVISNLLDNAIKYTPSTPVIIIRTRNNKKGLIISIEDNGIGIKSEDQKDIFKQFHRVHTGNIHDVKGFGLGLYYVSLITDAHGGNIKLTSEWGKGSIFEVFFPFNIEVK